MVKKHSGGVKAPKVVKPMGGRAVKQAAKAQGFTKQQANTARNMAKGVRKANVPAKVAKPMGGRDIKKAAKAQGFTKQQANTARKMAKSVQTGKPMAPAKIKSGKK